MGKFILLVFSMCALIACSHVSQESTAKKRAERLNAAKAEARTLVDAGRYAEALTVLEPLSEEASGDHQVFIWLGESYAALGRNNDAIRAFESAIRLAYQDYYGHLKLANLLMEIGKSGRALTEYELAARFGESDAVTRYDYGLALYEMGRKKRALEEWQAAYNLENGNPRYAEAVGIGMTEFNPEQAVKYFEAAAQLGAEGAGFHNNFGLALQRTGDYDRAGLQFGKAVDLEPAVEAYRFHLGAAYMNSGAYDDAIAVWDSLITRFGQKWSYTVYRGEALLASDRFEEAIHTVEPILAEYESGDLQKDEDRLDRTPPRHGDALEVLAMGHRGAGDGEGALAYIRRAVEVDPDNASYLNNYGVILAENGKIAEAKAQWKRVLEIDPDDVTARRNLSAFDP
jgi:tetratricopeptide (TPR) repeat protein